MQPAFSHGQYQRRTRDFLTLSEMDRVMCLDCGLLLLKGEDGKHAAHRLKRGVTDGMLATPTLLLQPLENNKTNAQYLFSDNSVQFFVNLFQQLGYKKILCIGAPRIHEAIATEKSSGLRSYLLDIDHRFEQFYGHDSFLRYNMFNHHVFAGEKAAHTFRKFLLQDTGPVAIITDPPFGGLVSLVSHTLQRITQLWKETNSIESCGKLPVFWIFPYFMESRIIESLPHFHMLDYKIEYKNHSSFHNGRESRPKVKGSPVRIFTNVTPSLIYLPTEQGYRFCRICDRYVSHENKHCELCGKCTSKDGTTYRHCTRCDRCVKPSRVHCDTCRQCELPAHSCGQPKTSGCHVCGDLSHKRRDCPKKASSFKVTSLGRKRIAVTASVDDRMPKRNKLNTKAGPKRNKLNAKAGPKRNKPNADTGPKRNKMNAIGQRRNLVKNRKKLRVKQKKSELNS